MVLVLLTIGSFALFFALARVLSFDDYPRGWVIRLVEIGIPLLIAAGLFAFARNGGGTNYAFIAAFFTAAAFFASIRKVADPILGRQEGAVIYWYSFAISFGVAFFAAQAFHLEIKF